MNELSKDTVLSLGLDYSMITMGDSFAQGKVFYATKYRDMYLTNFDVAQFENRVVDQNIKQDWMVYYRSNRLCYSYVATEILNNPVVFNQLLDHLYRNFTRQTVAGLPINLN